MFLSPRPAGLRGQSFDFTGVPGQIYSFISDQGLQLNAQLDHAYTTGLAMGAESNMVSQGARESGTWISAIGLRINEDRLMVSVEDADDPVCQPGVGEETTTETTTAASTAAIRPDSCFFGGTITLNDVQIRSVGDVSGYSIGVSVSNSKSYGVVRVSSEALDLM